MDLKELHSFKLSDAVKFHDELNPKLWVDGHLDPKVRNQLLLIAEDFVTELGIGKLSVEDITVSGSNAAYSYTPHSDLDLHIVVDMSELPDNDVYRELFNAKKVLYNDAHDITIHGVPVEVYVQNAAEPVVSLGEYSILHNRWIKHPVKRKANLDQNATRAKYDKLSELISLTLKTQNLDRLDSTLKMIKRYRQAGLAQGGEFSPENLAYKAIRSQGGIDKLYDLRDKLRGDKLSIEEASSREDAILKIKKLMNTAGRTPAEIENIKRIVDKMMKQWNVEPAEVGIRQQVDPLKAKLAKAAYEKTMAASALKGEWERFKRGIFAEDEELAEDFTTKQQVINHFVKIGKTAAQGAMAWERGWRGHKPKKTPEIKPYDPERYKNVRLPYIDESDKLKEAPRTFQSQSNPLEKLVQEYGHFTTLGNIHLDKQGATPEAQQQLLALVQRLNKDGKTFASMDKSKIASNKDTILNHIHQMMQYAIPILQKHLPANVWEAKRNQINAVLTAYNNARTITEASGYIPSEKEKNDPRFKTALTVDVKPDSIKKNAKAFNWKTSRAGIPPEANPNGKIAEDLMKEWNSFLAEDEHTNKPIHMINQEFDGASLDGYVVDTDQVQLGNYLESQGANPTITKKLAQQYNRIGIIKNMWVDEEERNQGLGTDLVSNAIDDAYLKGAEAVVLVSDEGESNEFNLTNWYESFGFKKIGMAGTDPIMLLTRSLSEDQEQQELFPGYDEQHREKRLGDWLQSTHAWDGHKPMTFYHATTKDFDTFNTHGTGFASALGMAFEVERHGSFFAVDPKFAESFIEDPNTGNFKEGGRVIPVHLSVQNPIDLRDNNLSYMLRDDETVDGFKANDIDLRSIYYHIGEYDRWELFDGPEGEDFVNNLQKLGFDGAIINEIVPNNNNAKSGEVWVVFNPNQVKSIHNRGSFSPDDPNLMREDTNQTVTLYHGTCEGTAKHLLNKGWSPNLGQQGGNMGQSRYLYCSTHPDDALWFAQEKGCDTVLTLVDVPLSVLKVDPEDGTADTLQDELNLPHGLPGKVVITKPIGPDYFKA